MLSVKPTIRSNPLSSSAASSIGPIQWSVEAGSTLTLNQNLIQYTNGTLGIGLNIAVKNSTGLSFQFSLSSVNASFGDIMPGYCRSPAILILRSIASIFLLMYGLLYRFGIERA